jgi:Helix-turn-helix
MVQQNLGFSSGSKAHTKTQSGLAKELNTSGMAVSRWERGEAEPSAEAYIRLGHLAGDPLCWFFGGRAGLSTADLMRILPAARRRLRQGGIADVQVVHAGAVKVKSLKPTNFVAIPVLPVHAATPGADAGDPRKLFAEASQELQLTARFKSLSNHFIPSRKSQDLVEPLTAYSETGLWFFGLRRLTQRGSERSVRGDPKKVGVEECSEPSLLFSELESKDGCVQGLGRTHGIEIFP